MSVNGGFATSLIDGKYNTLVYNLLYLLQYRIRKFYKNETVNEHNFRTVFLKATSKAIKLEQSKFAPPKFSEAVLDMVSLLTEMKQQSPASTEMQQSQLTDIKEYIQHEICSSPTTKKRRNPQTPQRKSRSPQQRRAQESGEKQQWCEQVSGEAVDNCDDLRWEPFRLSQIKSGSQLVKTQAKPKIKRNSSLAHHRRLIQSPNKLPSNRILSPQSSQGSSHYEYLLNSSFCQSHKSLSRRKYPLQPQQAYTAAQQDQATNQSKQLQQASQQLLHQSLLRKNYQRRHQQ